MGIEGIKGVAATAFATVGLWGLTAKFLGDNPVIYGVWVVLGVILAVV